MIFEDFLLPIDFGHPLFSQATVDDNKAKHLAELFGELTHDVQMNLEAQNRERFTSNLTNFRYHL
jgi:hypothetical protein